MHKIICRRALASEPSYSGDINPVLARIYAARGIGCLQETEYKLQTLLPYHDLLNIDLAVKHLAQALSEQQKILIVGDFDADGATSTSLAVHALRAMGAQQVSYLVPNRFTFGYGLTPEIVDVAYQQKPDLIITVDNGISSVEGVARANHHGINVLVTDHHLPGKCLPDAVAIVNPNQDSDNFASKNIAGVGVIFYVLSALRAYLREQGYFAEHHIKEPNMGDYLDLVALGTVADVVALDQTNRTLVAQGIARIRAGRVRPGIEALLKIAKKDPRKVMAADFGFGVGPRLNAAGRLEDMSLGIECLLAEDMSTAMQAAQHLDALNVERRVIEQDMKAQAVATLNTLSLKLKGQALPEALTLHEADWHQGVIGIVAGRIKEQFHRPVIAFACSGDTELKGSARSIPGLHIRDALDRVASRYPGLILKFGGHAMAAGLSIEQNNLQQFAAAFKEVVADMIPPEALTGKIYSDGPLARSELTFDFAKLLQEAGPWGQAFPEPVFDNEFWLISQRIVGERHLKCSLAIEEGGRPVDGIYFFVDLNDWADERCRKVHAAYQLDINEYQGNYRVQLIIRQLEKIA